MPCFISFQGNIFCVVFHTGYTISKKLILNIERVSLFRGLERTQANKLAFLRVCFPWFSHLFQLKSEERECLLSEVSIKIYQNNKIGIFSPRSEQSLSLAKIMANLNIQDNGKIYCNCSPLLIGAFGKLFKPMLSVSENVNFMLSAVGVDYKRLKESHNIVINQCELNEFKKNMLYDISEVQTRRLAFYCFLQSSRDLVILHHTDTVRGAEDEFTMRQRLSEFLKNKTVIMFSDNKEMLYEYTNQIYYLGGKRLSKEESSQEEVDIEKIDSNDYDITELDDDEALELESYKENIKPIKKNEIALISDVQDPEGINLHYKNITLLKEIGEPIELTFKINSFKTLRIKNVYLELTTNTGYRPSFSKSLLQFFQEKDLFLLKEGDEKKIFINFRYPSLPPGGFGLLVTFEFYKFSKKYRYKLSNFGRAGNLGSENRSIGLLDLTASKVD